MRRALPYLCLAFFLVSGACAGPLATLPPSDTYTAVEETPRMTSDEQELFATLNKEFVKLGLPEAAPGSYERNAAAIMANAALSKLWTGSGRAVANPSGPQGAEVVQGAVSDQSHRESKHEVANGRLASLTDEQDDTDVKHLHAGQRFSSMGLVPQMRSHLLMAQLAETQPTSDELKEFVRSLRPRTIDGRLTLGVAILPVGDADQRIFAVVLRERAFDLTQGPPRTAAPSQSFEIAGTVVDPAFQQLKLAVAGPNGKVQLRLIPVAQGAFHARVTLPDAIGLDVVSLKRIDGEDGAEMILPVFAGVTPTPWPVAADPKAVPVDGTRSIVQRLAKAVADYRHSHGLPALPIDADLSAFAKAEATLHAKAEDDQAGPGSGTPHATVEAGAADRLRAANLNPDQIYRNWNVWGDDYVNDFLARFPGKPSAIAAIGSATAQAVGLGVALVPNDVTKDSDLVRYSVVWMVKDPTPPMYEADPAPQARR